ncbi:MAG TPA: DUF438 domain-containing protein [bacterium]|nr:DUF438 domain-containing protein [bacterium]
MSDEAIKQELKSLLKRVTANTSKEELDILKKEFKTVFEGADPMLIAAAEAELLKEGGSIEDLMKACDVHLELFKDSIKNPQLKVPDGHPIKIFQEDHKNILFIMEKLVDEIKEAEKQDNYDDAKVEIMMIEKLVNRLMEAENHNVRQENTLFPVLEKHGIEQPPQIMWHEHTEMKAQKKELLKLINDRKNYEFKDFLKRALALSVMLLEKFGGHTQKEEHILYVTAMNVITDDEWKDIKEECDNLGYFAPGL